MTTPTLGHTPNGKPVRLDVDRLVESRMLLQANSGGGKSWALRRLLEQTHCHVQQLVLDVEGEFYTLREKYSYAYVARHGVAGTDAVADPRTAGKLAHLLLATGASAIVDLYELPPRDRIAFVRAFLEALIDAPKDLRHPCLVVIDEAHLFCPEKGEAESRDAVIDLMTRGRKRGLCGVLATQRLSKLRKDAAAEANVKLIGRAALDLDMERAGDELGFNKADRQRLRALDAGDFFAFGPGLAEEVVQFHVGEVQTTHPKAGSRAAPVPPTPEKLANLLAPLKELPKQAAEEARTLAQAQTRIRELERDLRAKPVPVAAAPTKPLPPEVIEVHAVAGRFQDRIEKTVARLDVLAGVLVEQAAALRGDLAKCVKEGEARKLVAAARPLPAARPIPPAPQAGRVSTPRPQTRPVAPAAGLSRPQQELLNALAWLESMRISPARRGQVALVAKVSSTSSGFEKNIGVVKVAGYVVYPTDGHVELTREGRAIAVVSDRPPTQEEMHSAMLSRVSGPQRALLVVLLEQHGDPISREDLAARADPPVSVTSSGFEKNVGTLKSLGLAVYPADGMVAAAPVLFLEGAA